MSKPFVYLGLSQAPSTYELCFVSDGAEVTYYGTLAEFTLLAENIIFAIAEQQDRDAERPLSG